MSADCGWAIDFCANAQRSDWLFLIEPARTPAKFGIFRAANDLPAAIAIRGREHDFSPAPAHLGLAILNAQHSGFFMHMKEQLDFVPATALKAIFDGDIAIGPVETEVAPVGNRILQARVSVVFSFDHHPFSTSFEP